MSQPARLITAEEFAKIPDDDCRYELVEGRVVKMSPPGARHGRLAIRLAVLLEQHVAARGLGVVLGEAGCHIASNPDTVRGPDVSFLRRERIPETGLPDGFWRGAPDLAVEIRSPGDRRAAIEAKVDDYLTRGVRLVWVINPKDRTVTVYQRLAPPRTLRPHELLDGGAVLDGFACRVGAIFEESPLIAEP